MKDPISDGSRRSWVMGSGAGDVAPERRQPLGFPRGHRGRVAGVALSLCGLLALAGPPLVFKLGIDFGETSDDGRFTLVDVQCLGACGEAPIIQVNNDYYTNLSVEKLDQMLDDLK